jgi:xanthine dehydrogenase YagR molybdenum-binding subunit
LGTKGMGELTAVAVAPAIVNAVYHATGKRIRDLPVSVEKLL